MLKNHQISHTVQWCRTIFPLCMKRSVLAPVSLKSPPPPKLPSVHWLVSSAAVQSQFIRDKPVARHTWCTCVTLWHSVMSQSYKIKGRTTDEAFQEQCFLWERGASFVADFTFFFKLSRSFTCTKSFITHQREEQNEKAWYVFFNKTLSIVSYSCQFKIQNEKLLLKWTFYRHI